MSSPHNDDAAGWASARCLEDLADATTTDFVSVDESPGLPVPGETDENFFKWLVMINNLGLVTSSSQAGEHNDHAVQRAFVAGICTFETASLIVSGLSLTDFVTILFRPGTIGMASIPVTVLTDGTQHTCLGTVDVTGEADHYRNGNPELDEDLDQACYIQVFDSKWGRNDLLWPMMVAALSGEHLK